MVLDDQFDEITAWAESAPHDEFRFTLFFVPYVIKKEDQYLVAYKGQPPERKKIHLATMPRDKDGTTPDDAYQWVKRSGIMGFMSAGYEIRFADRFKKWWAGPDVPKQRLGHTPPELPPPPPLEAA